MSPDMSDRINFSMSFMSDETGAVLSLCEHAEAHSPDVACDNYRVSLTATIVQHRNSCTAIFHILCALKSTRETADQILPLVVLNQHANKK